MLEAEKHIKGLSCGTYHPQVFSCLDGKKYVIKFKRPKRTRFLVNEFIVHRMATLLELPIPKGEPVLFSQDICNLYSQVPYICTGVQWGVEYLQNSVNASASDNPENIVNRECIPGIVMLDWLVINIDRSNGDNLLIAEAHGDNYLYIIDHENSFGGHNWNAATLREAAPDKTAFSFYEPLLQYIVGKNPFEHYFTKFATITVKHFWSVVNELPEEWQVTRGDKQGMVDFLTFRQKMIKAVFKEYQYLFPKWI